MDEKENVVSSFDCGGEDINNYDVMLSDDGRCRPDVVGDDLSVIG